MNHKLIYENIISIATKQKRCKLDKSDPNYTYFENHHILPKCLNGTDNPNNLVLLTAKEHYVCHKLLTFIFPNNKIYHAFHLMTTSGKNLKYSSNDYLYAKELKSLAMINNNPSKNTKVAKKIGLGNKGKKVSEEAKKKMSLSKKGHSVSKNTILKINKTKKERGIIPWMVGKKHKNESISKLKNSLKKVPNKQCEFCGIITIPGNYVRWHGNNCKNKNKKIS